MAVIVKKHVALPCTSEPICGEQWPAFNAEDYAARLERLLSALDKSFTHMVFYGRRELFRT